MMASLQCLFSSVIFNSRVIEPALDKSMNHISIAELVVNCPGREGAKFTAWRRRPLHANKTLSLVVTIIQTRTHTYSLTHTRARSHTPAHAQWQIQRANPARSPPIQFGFRLWSPPTKK